MNYNLFLFKELEDAFSRKIQADYKKSLLTQLEKFLAPLAPNRSISFDKRMEYGRFAYDSRKDQQHRDGNIKSILDEEDKFLKRIPRENEYRSIIEEFCACLNNYMDKVFLSDVKSEGKSILELYSEKIADYEFKVYHTYKKELYIIYSGFTYANQVVEPFNYDFKFVKQEIKVLLFLDFKKEALRLLETKANNLADDYMEHFNNFVINKFNDLSLFSNCVTENEKQKIFEDRVKLKLWTTLGTGEITQWLTDYVNRIEGGYVHLDNYKLVYSAGGIDKSKIPFNPYSRQYDHSFGKVIPTDDSVIDQSEVEFPIELYKKLTGKNYDEIYDELPCNIGVSREDTLKPFVLDGRQRWKHKPIPDEIKCDNFLNINFSHSDKSKNIVYIGSIEHDPTTGNTLPASYWQKDGSTLPIKVNVPFCNLNTKKFPLLNQDLLFRYKDAEILLTCQLSLAAFADRNKSNILMLSWYGGIDTLEHVSFDLLKGRKVKYLIIQHADELGLKREYKIAYEVYQKISDLKPFFCEVKIQLAKDKKKNKIAIEIISEKNCEDFKIDAERILDLQLPALPSRKYFKIHPKVISALKNTEDRDFLLAPIIYHKTVTILYAPTSVGKTWLALTMAYAISIGGRFFHTWNAKSSNKVLYIDNEMDSLTFKMRLNLIRKMNYNRSFYSIQKNIGNLRIILKEDKLFSLPRAEFQNEVLEYVKSEGIKFIVIDNLSSFTQHNDSASAWEVINSWLYELQQIGCSSLVVHHANKNLDQRGTSAKTNTADNVIKLIKKSTEDFDLGFQIQIEKGRDIFGFSKKPFSVFLDTNKNKPAWHLAHSEERELVENRILEDLLRRGHSNVFIGNYLGWGKSKVIERKEKLGKKHKYKRQDRLETQ